MLQPDRHYDPAGRPEVARRDAGRGPRCPGAAGTTDSVARRCSPRSSSSARSGIGSTTNSARSSKPGRVKVDAALNSGRYLRLLDRLEDFIEGAAGQRRGPTSGRMQPCPTCWPRTSRGPTNAPAVPCRREPRTPRPRPARGPQGRQTPQVRGRSRPGPRFRQTGQRDWPPGRGAADAAGRASGLRSSGSAGTPARSACCAFLAGENGFTFGRLHALEEAHAGELERADPDALSGLPAEKLRKWLGK